MWGYRSKGVAEDRAKIITCSENFHGRTITIVSFSTDPDARKDFGPFTPGFVTVDYGDPAALEAAIDDDTVAFLVEPIQGEAGVNVPPEGYLQAVREICTRRNTLMIADEIQSGLGRTGYTFACEHDGVEPDLYILGKALGGGIMPLSAVAGGTETLGLFKPGEHGSTFGGNPVACAIGREVIALLKTGEFQQRSAELGTWLIDILREQAPDTVAEIRGRGLWVGIQLKPGMKKARAVCEELMDQGVLCKDTHEHTIRLAPPLVVTRDDLQWALDRIIPALASARP
jgi:ornithine--oxo-acid transaminase